MDLQRVKRGAGKKAGHKADNEAGEKDWRGV
jgi:hypothetical protein